LPKEDSFPWVRFDIIWLILWGIESGSFDEFSTRSHRDKNKYMSRKVKIFFKFSG
jgi:hypothetical protein